MNRGSRAFDERGVKQKTPAVAPASLRDRIFYERASRFSRFVLRSTLVLVAVLTALKGTFCESFFVPSDSMIPTLRSSDYILVPKFMYGLKLPFFSDTVISWSQPGSGDVIVFRRTPRGLNGFPHTVERMVKRVVGVEGDTIQVKGSYVFRNGKLLLEPYAVWSSGVERSEFGPAVVPPGTVFVLGDNRDDSEDSRFWPEPFVPVGQIEGRVLLIYWSSSDRTRILKFVR